MNKLLTFFITLMMLLQSRNYLDWQGTGNMSESNMTFIWNYIKANFNTSWKRADVAFGGGDTRLVNFATGLSNSLNSEWAQAWNVVVIFLASINQRSDAVLYGYAFRGHWMWYNGYKTDESYYLSFVIWKDYNCIKWQTINGNSFKNGYQNSNPAPLISAIKNFSTLNQKDPWLAAKAYVDKFESDAAVKAALGSNIAFSVIMSQSKYTMLFGRFCAKDYYITDNVGGDKQINWGKALTLQMR